jgi:hypothetical protein
MNRFQCGKELVPVLKRECKKTEKVVFLATNWFHKAAMKWVKCHLSSQGRLSSSQLRKRRLAVAKAKLHHGSA